MGATKRCDSARGMGVCNGKVCKEDECTGETAQRCTRGMARASTSALVRQEDRCARRYEGGLKARVGKRRGWYSIVFSAVDNLLAV